MNKTLDLPHENLNVEAELYDFFDLIHYEDKVKLGKIIKKHIRREWSFIFDTILRVLTCRNTGFDQVNLLAQQLVNSLAYGKKLNVGKLIFELVTRIGKSTSKRGNQICIPRFIQFVLNYKH